MWSDPIVEETRKAREEVVAFLGTLHSRNLGLSTSIVGALVAYGLVVLLREAAAEVEEVCRATVGTLRSRLWKVGAWVEVRARRVCLHVSESWPGRQLWVRVQQAVASFAEALSSGPAAGVAVGLGTGVGASVAGPPGTTSSAGM